MFSRPCNQVVKFDQSIRRLAINANDFITDAQASLLGRSVRLHCRNRERSGAGFDPSAEPEAMGNFRAEELGEGFGNLPGRNGKADALTLAVNGDTQTDEFAAQIDERAATVARINGG